MAIYVFEVGEYVKVGFTARDNIWKRINEICYGPKPIGKDLKGTEPEHCTPLLWIPAGTIEEEQHFHALFKRNVKMGREWYPESMAGTILYILTSCFGLNGCMVDYEIESWIDYCVRMERERFAKEVESNYADIPEALQ